MAVLAAACSEESFDVGVSQALAVPVVGARDLVHDSIALEAPRVPCATGETFSSDTYDFLLEGREGYHVIARIDTGEIRPIAFLRVPGTSELSAVGPVLLTNSYADIVRLKLDLAGGTVTVTSALPNALAPANGFPVDDSELVTGFEVRVVPVQQTADGMVLAAWRCETCFEQIETGIPSNQSGEVTIITSDRMAALALSGLNAFVGDGQRLTAYQSIGETFVKTNDRNFDDPITALVTVNGGLLADIGFGKAIVSTDDLSSRNLSATVGTCDFAVADAGLVAVTRNTKASCGSKLTAGLQVLYGAPTAQTLNVIGTIALSEVRALAIYGDDLFAAVGRTVTVLGREPTQADRYIVRQKQLLTLRVAYRPNHREH